MWGGGAITPSMIVSGQLLKNNATKNVTIDLSKRYFVIAGLLFTTDTARSSVWYIENGIITAMRSATSYSAISISGSTLTLKGTNATINSEFDVVCLD